MFMESTSQFDIEKTINELEDETGAEHGSSRRSRTIPAVKTHQRRFIPPLFSKS
jgi:hypothetical protein